MRIKLGLVLALVCGTAQGMLQFEAEKITHKIIVVPVEAAGADQSLEEATVCYRSLIAERHANPQQFWLKLQGGVKKAMVDLNIHQFAYDISKSLQDVTKEGHCREKRSRSRF